MINIKRNKEIFLMIMLLVSLLFTTIVYSAFSTQLQIKGDAIVRSDQIIRITGLKLLNTTNDAYETYSSKYEKDTISLYVTLPASSSITYEVAVTNKNSDKMYFLKEMIPLINNNSNIKVEHNIKTGDYIKRNSTKLFTVTLTNKTSSKQTITFVNQYKFEAVEWAKLETKFLSTYDTGDFRVDKDGIIFEFSVTNLNPVTASYIITSDNSRFTIIDEKTNDNKFQIEPDATVTHKIRVKLKSGVVYEKLIQNLNLMVKTTSPKSSTTNVKTVKLNLPENFNTVILNTMVVKNSPEKFTTTEATNGHLFRINEMTDSSYTYYYRGVINNNYVLFANKLWRIVRIDANGNIRLVLDVNAEPESKYSSKYVTDNVQNIEEAIDIVDYRKSDVRKKVEDWYDKNIATKDDSKYIATSNFCVDLSYQGPIDTKDEHTVYYFTPYLHVGRDSNSFKPDFSCKTENIFKSNVGLLSAEEVLAAGGYWEIPNKNYYLYNPDLAEDNQTSWTMSGSYYSISEKQAGVIVFNQEGKSLFDWVRGGNIAQFYGYRPVISIKGNLKAAGDGTKDNPYQIIA